MSTLFQEINQVIEDTSIDIETKASEIRRILDDPQITKKNLTILINDLSTVSLFLGTMKVNENLYPVLEEAKKHLVLLKNNIYFINDHLLPDK
jgi:hypothetical protein